MDDVNKAPFVASVPLGHPAPIIPPPAALKKQPRSLWPDYVEHCLSAHATVSAASPVANPVSRTDVANLGQAD